MTTTNLPKISVRRIGQFAGGSFGAGGNPADVYTMYAVICPRNSGNFPKQGFVFRSESEANKAAKEEVEYEIEQAEKKAMAEKKAKQLAEHKASLLRGWDGYRFVGIEKGAELAGKI